MLEDGHLSVVVIEVLLSIAGANFPAVGAWRKVIISLMKALKVATITDSSFYASPPIRTPRELLWTH